MSKPIARTTTPEEGKAIFTRLLDEAIKPNADTIAPIIASGRIAVVFYNLSPNDALVQEAARSFGWAGGECEIHELTRTRAERLADLLPPGDGASRWLRGLRPGRIFLFTERANFCINHDSGRGFSLEPGTLDHQWMS